VSAAPTPGQTVGPFFGYALPYPGGEHLVAPGHPGAIRLGGLVLDGAGQPVPDALLELWQPAPDGTLLQRPGSLARDGWELTGWGRAATDGAGAWAFTTLRPGAAGAGRRPFFALTVFARGLLDRLFTRIYLPDGDGVADPLLDALPADRRDRLVARPDPSGLRFDVVLQGPGETPFLSFGGRG
jgi:protocatechuate 3,4-dioxygenase alpha subunit